MTSTLFTQNKPRNHWLMFVRYFLTHPVYNFSIHFIPGTYCLNVYSRKLETGSFFLHRAHLNRFKK